MLIGHTVRSQICYYGPQRLRVALLLCSMLAAAVVGGTLVTRQARIGRAAGGTACATAGGWKQALRHGNPEVVVALRGDTQVKMGLSNVRHSLRRSAAGGLRAGGAYIGPADQSIIQVYKRTAGV